MKDRIAKDLIQENLSFEEALIVQNKYSKYALKANSNSSLQISYDAIHILAGVDVSYYRNKRKEIGVACAVFWDLKQKFYSEVAYGIREINYPYKAGFLGFREINVINEAIRNAKLAPDLIMCDGHGIIHPRCFGEAVHIGLALDIPSFGIAKNSYVGIYDSSKVSKLKGIRTPIWKREPNSDVKKHSKLGYCMCLADRRKPVFISIGYKVSLQIAIRIALQSTLSHRQPEPLYLADKFSRQKLKEVFKL